MFAGSSRYWSCLIVGIASLAPLIACGQPSPDAKEERSFQEVVQPFFVKHCLECHDKDSGEGDLRLDVLAANFLDPQSAAQWVEILDRMNLGEMPPKDQPRPAGADLTQVTDWITAELQRARNRGDSTGGRVLLRRLSRQEYANTVRDLLKVDFVEGEGPIDLLPPDGSIKGFDRNSKALLVDPSLMDAYLTVAQRVADQAIRFRPPLIAEKTMRFQFRDTAGSPMQYIIDGRAAYLQDGRMVLMEGGARTFAQLRHPYNDKEVPTTGRYRVRVKAAADPGDRAEPVYMNIKQGPGDSIAQFRVDAPPDDPQVYEFVTTRDELFQGEYEIRFVNGTQFTKYVAARGEQLRTAKELFDQGNVFESTRIKSRLRAQGDFDTNVRGAFEQEVLHVEGLPKLYLDWIEVTGPLRGEFPPPSMKSMFLEGWEPEKLSADYARKIFTRLLPRAYRRPIQSSEVNELMELVNGELDRGHDFQTAIKTGVTAILCSPKFLYLYEPSSQTDAPRTLNEFELASRLSYFLWSSKPDDDLFRLAAKKQLSKPGVLQTQVDRMIADPRSEGFHQGFLRQWLKIDEFNRFPPDERIFPEFYQTQFKGLEDDFVEQPLAMLRELIQSDKSLVLLLDSQWTMLNERLAAFYGIAGVTGSEFQKVRLSPQQSATRGGLLGMAGVHRWGSDGNRTKPVERGKYVLDVLFNDPPPPPPANAGEVEPNIRGEQLTVRERLRRHRQQVTCMNCHRRIDPYGLAFENFNVIGRWREKLDGEKPLAHWGDDRPEIDVSGTLPGGDHYENYVEFKRSLLKQQDRFIRGVTEKLLMYALARTIEASDRPVIDDIVNQAKENGYSLRSILKGIVACELFRQK